MSLLASSLFSTSSIESMDDMSTSILNISGSLTLIISTSAGYRHLGNYSKRKSFDDITLSQIK